MRFVHLPGFLHAPLAALAVAILCGAWTHCAAAADAPPQKAETPAPKILLAPDAEAKLKEVIDKARIEKRKVWELRMKKEIDDIARATGMGDDGRKALEAPATQAIEASLDGWGVKLDDVLRKEMGQMQKSQILASLNQMIAQASAIAQSDYFMGDMARPYEQEGWNKAVHQTLTPVQAAAWDKAQAERKQEIEKEIAGVLSNGAEQTRHILSQEALAKSQQLKMELALPKDRADKLDDLAKSVADQCVDVVQKRTEKMLLAMNDVQRSQIVKNGRFYMGTEPSDAPSKQPAWTDGVAKILTPDEVKRLDTLKAGQATRRAQALAQVMIMLMDEKIALTSSQREQLQPVAERMVKDLPEETEDRGNGIAYTIFQPQAFFTAGAKAGDADLKPILDDVQWKHWQDLVKPSNSPANHADDDKKTEESPEPEYVEQQISKYLYERTEREKETVFGENLLKAEDLTRVAGLKPETAARFQTAARGTAEAALSTWKTSAEQVVRSQTQESTPQNVKQRLESIQDYNFGQRDFGESGNNEPQTVWDKTVKQELTADQQEAWRKATKERSAFREKAISLMIVAQFDAQTALTDDQRTKLEPIISKIVHDYAQDIMDEFSSDSDSPWYMGYYAMLPFAGIPEADLKAILTKEQYEHWTTSPEFANASQVWNYIDQNHKQRTGQNQNNQ